MDRAGPDAGDACGPAHGVRAQGQEAPAPAPQEDQAHEVPERHAPPAPRPRHQPLTQEDPMPQMAYVSCRPEDRAHADKIMEWWRQGQLGSGWTLAAGAGEGRRGTLSV